MKLTYLGTSAAVPTLKRSLSSTVLSLDGESIMVDCGEGTQMRYLEAGLKWNKPITILFTHLHSDHCMGIFGILQTMEMQGRTEQVRIFGPRGIYGFIHSVKRSININFTFPFTITEISDGSIISGNDYTIFAKKSEHRTNSLAYLFVEYNRAGNLDVEKARSLGVKDGPDMGLLKDGKDVIVETSPLKVVRSVDVVSLPRKGRRIGFSGDTRPTLLLQEFFKDCDYLTFESTFTNDEKENAIKAGHSTAEEAAVLAQRADVKTLILNHFSARHASTEPFFEEAFPVFPNVKCAKDLMVVDID